jgi:CheY-like chemotaxis protein
MIVIIDDEKYRTIIVCKILAEAGYNVFLINSIDKAKEFLGDNWLKIDAIILDIMMAWESSFTQEETELGLLTGVRLYELLRDKYGNLKPIIIYTALNRPTILNKIKKDPNTSVIYKTQLAYKLVDELSKFRVKPKEFSGGKITYVD